jgi:hypothetical protein
MLNETDRRTITPEVEGLDFTALAVAAEKFFLSSSQTLYLLSNPSAEILAHTTAQTTPIHTIIYSPEKNVLSTAAVGERFINVFTNESDSLNRIGSLTCAHDVRTFLVQDDTLLAITVVGTLEVFQLFDIGFDSTRKGGMTKPPNAVLRLTASHGSKIEIQDAVPRGQDTLVSWVEGGKTGFESLNLHTITGETEITIESRRDQQTTQVSSLYNKLTRP